MHISMIIAYKAKFKRANSVIEFNWLEVKNPPKVGSPCRGGLPWFGGKTLASGSLAERETKKRIGRWHTSVSGLLLLLL